MLDALLSLNLSNSLLFKLLQLVKLADLLLKLSILSFEFLKLLLQPFNLPLQLFYLIFVLSALSLDLLLFSVKVLDLLLQCLNLISVLELHVLVLLLK